MWGTRKKVVQISIFKAFKASKLQNFVFVRFLMFVFPLPHHITHNLNPLFTSQHIEFNQIIIT